MASVVTSEVLIIGGGPAGLAAAGALSRMLVSTTIFDSGLSRNGVAKHMHNFPGFDHAAPADFRAAARRDLKTRYQTNTFVECNINSLKKRDDGLFEMKDDHGQVYVGKKVILATGARDIFPDVPEYETCWGKSIFHCLFCHGYEERGSKKAGLLAEGFLSNPQFALPISAMANRLADHVVVFTNGDEKKKSELEDGIKNSNLTTKVDARRISRLENLDGKDGKRIAVHFENGNKEELGFLGHTPKLQLNIPKTWIQDLGLKVTEQGNLEITQPFGETSCPGVFACGDVSNTMKAVATAISAGTLAGGGVVHQLCVGR